MSSPTEFLAVTVQLRKWCGRDNRTKKREHGLQSISASRRGEPWNILTAPLLAQQTRHLLPFHWAHTSQIKNQSTGRSGNCWPRPHNWLHTDPGLTSLLPHVGFPRFHPNRGLCFSSLALKTWTAVFCHLTKVQSVVSICRFHIRKLEQACIKVLKHEVITL